MKNRRSWLAVAVLAPILTSCAGERPAEPDVPTLSSEATDPSSETFALGNHINPDGTLQAESAGEEFRRGGELFVSVNVTGATAQQEITVEWRDPRDQVIKREIREVVRGRKHVAFSSGDTAKWAAGEHRAVVMMNGRRVIEKPFVIL